MNLSIVRYILGQVIRLEGILLLLPCMVGLIYRENCTIYFAVSVLICLLCGTLLSFRKPSNHIFYLKEGCVATSLSWICMSLFGCLPFYLSGEIPSFLDALFETVSGFTTTGSSILSDIESLSHASLFWRSFTHWVGGMGVLVFLLTILPIASGSNINLMKAESPGPSVGKLVPKIQNTAMILYAIYFAMTIAEILFLLMGKMPLFDAMTTAFGTAGTGGFGIKNDSIAGYSSYIQWVITIFMMLFGVNFNAYYLILFGKLRQALKMEEVKYYLLIILCATLLITINILSMSKGFFDALTHSAFQVASIISSTGFSTVDFDLWPQTSRFILVCLMFVGACAGSTGGGIKVSRFVILIKTIHREFSSYIHPRSVHRIRMEDKTLDHGTIQSVSVYAITFLMIFVSSMFLVSFEKDTDLLTTFTSVTTTLNNIGPGLALAGPTQNFGFFSPLSKCVFIFDMLAGRLELFPMLLLLHPGLWKDSYHAVRRRFRRKN